MHTKENKTMEFKRNNIQYKDLEKILITEDELSARIHQLAAQISKDYEGKCPLVVAILSDSASPALIWRIFKVQRSSGSTITHFG